MDFWTLIPAAILLFSLLSLNCLYGLLLGLGRPPRYPNRKDQWFTVFFGLQAALGILLSDYADRGRRQVVILFLGGLAFSVSSSLFLTLVWQRWGGATAFPLSIVWALYTLSTLTGSVSFRRQSAAARR